MFEDAQCKLEKRCKMDEMQEDRMWGAEDISTPSMRGLVRLSLSMGSITTIAWTIALLCIFTCLPCTSLLLGFSIDAGCHACFSVG